MRGCAIRGQFESLASYSVTPLSKVVICEFSKQLIYLSRVEIDESFSV